MRATRVLILLFVACDSRSGNAPLDAPYCPNGDCILNLCECGSDSCSGIEPRLCGSAADCGSGEACTFEFDDTQQCSPTCNGDGTGCPTGYTCKTFVP
jgi:hypothetical protein